MAKRAWYKNGIQFSCQGSGKCCTSRGEYGYVYLTQDDRIKMAQELGLSEADFVAQYCAITDGCYHLVDNPESPDCIFLENNQCAVYAARPTQCRTWPFWPEHMGAKAWKKEVVSFCPGVNQGRVYTAQEIDKILNEQKKSEEEIFGL